MVFEVSENKPSKDIQFDIWGQPTAIRSGYSGPRDPRDKEGGSGHGPQQRDLNTANPPSPVMFSVDSLSADEDEELKAFPKTRRSQTGKKAREASTSTTDMRSYLLGNKKDLGPEAKDFCVDIEKEFDVGRLEATLRGCQVFPRIF